MEKISIVADYDENGEAILIDIYYDEDKNIKKINYAGVVINEKEINEIENFSEINKDFLNFLEKIKEEVKDNEN